MDEIKYLVDWLVRYLKNRDLSFRRIKELKIEDGVVSVLNKDGSCIQYVIILVFESPKAIFEKFGSADYCDFCIITLHSKENVSFLIQHWDLVSSKPRLLILFVNPFSQPEEKWVIRPSIHAKVCEKKNLARSFASISENVSVTSVSEYKKQLAIIK